MVSAAARLFGVRAAGHALGVSMAGLAVWQMRYDVAGDAMDRAAHPRYMAIGVRAGTVWLLVGGGLLAFIDPPPGGPVYDAILHAVFVGFVLSTGFGHALSVVPVLAGGHVPFSPLFYAPLALLHATLVVRLAGDLSGALWVRQLGGVGNALAIALFAVVMASAALRGRYAREIDGRTTHPIRSSLRGCGWPCRTGSGSVWRDDPAPNSKPHALQRAGRISMRSPRAAADRSMCCRSSTSLRRRPSSRASDETERGS